MTHGVPVRIKVDNAEAVAGTLEMGTDTIDTTSIGGTTRPNLAWEMVDPSGHFHAWDRDGTLPTADTRREHVCGLDSHDHSECDGYDVIHYVCQICGWELEPATVTDHSPTSTPGRSWWTVVTSGVDLTLYRMAKVSVVITAGDGFPKFFGVAQVISVGMVGDEGGMTHMATLQGAGPLGRKR
jgi:hypothetical protein